MLAVGCSTIMFWVVSMLIISHKKIWAFFPFFLWAALFNVFGALSYYNLTSRSIEISLNLALFSFYLLMLIVLLRLIRKQL